MQRGSVKKIRTGSTTSSRLVERVRDFRRGRIAVPASIGQCRRRRAAVTAEVLARGSHDEVGSTNESSRQGDGQDLNPQRGSLYHLGEVSIPYISTRHVARL